MKKTPTQDQIVRAAQSDVPVGVIMAEDSRRSASPPDPYTRREILSGHTVYTPAQCEAARRAYLAAR